MLLRGEVVRLAGAGAQFVGGDRAAVVTNETPDASLLAASPDGPRTLPLEVRGVHVTMGLASLEGKLEEYVDLEREGLTTIELDIKEENGRIGFRRGAPALAKAVGAAQSFYEASRAARLVHSRGLYLVGRIVVFEDPMLSSARPDLAVRRTDGSVWRDAAGLGWANPYDRRVWKYNADLAVAAAKAGFDEILFDYVRRPDGAFNGMTVPGLAGDPAVAVANFVRASKQALVGTNATLGASVFGISATRPEQIAQDIRLLIPSLDYLAPMVYPSL